MSQNWTAVTGAALPRFVVDGAKLTHQFHMRNVDGAEEVEQE